jgi:ATP-binding cassette subfamily C protein
MASFTKIIAGANNLNFNHVLEDSICNELNIFKVQLANTDFKDHIILPQNRETFKSEIELNQVCFKYSGSDENNIDGISLTIKKGDSVAFTGPSGAGKTTLANIILGLLKASTGTVMVDGINIAEMVKNHYGFIGYVPQSIFLSDDTLRHNIAFGIVEHLIDDKAVMNAIELAQLVDVVNDLPDGIQTVIGEKGARLSGGQQQRIGLARALYFDSDIIVLDEATSALDGETEMEVSQAIEKLAGEKTFIIISHRLSTIKNCNRIYYLVDGKINAEGTFEDLLKRNHKFHKMVQSQLVHFVT